MRSDRIIGAALLVLAFGLGDEAEARGRGGRAVIRSATVASVPVAATGSIAASAQAGTEPSDPASRPVEALTAPAVPALREVRASESWCTTRRLVGTGTGFCLIN